MHDFITSFNRSAPLEITRGLDFLLFEDGQIFLEMGVRLRGKYICFSVSFVFSLSHIFLYLSFSFKCLEVFFFFSVEALSRNYTRLQANCFSVTCKQGNRVRHLHCTYRMNVLTSISKSSTVLIKSSF